MPDDRPQVPLVRADRARQAGGPAVGTPSATAAPSAIAADTPAPRQGMPLPPASSTSTIRVAGAAQATPQASGQPPAYAPQQGASMPDHEGTSARRVERPQETSAFAEPLGVSTQGPRFVPAPVQESTSEDVDEMLDISSTSPSVQQNTDEDDLDPVKFTVKQAKTLRDVLQAGESKFARNEMYIVVHRKSPKVYGGVPTQGFLGRFTGSEVTEEWFAESFGGSEYHIDVEAVDFRAPPRVDGRPGLKKVHEIKHQCPGPPVIHTSPAEQPVTQGLDSKLVSAIALQAVNSGLGGGGGRGADGALPAVLAAVNNANQSAVQAERSRAQDLAQITQTLAEEERRRRQDAEDRLRQTQDELRAARQPSVDTGLTDVLKSVLTNPRGGEDLMRASEMATERIERMARDHTEALRQKDIQVQERIEYARKEAQLEREALRAEHARVQEMQARENKLQLEAIERRYEAQIAQMTRDRDADLDRAQKAKEHEVKMLELNFKSQLDTMNSVAGLRGETRDAELRRLSEELARLRVENENLKAQVFIPPDVAIAKATSLARTVGYVHQSEVPDVPDENSMSAVAATIAKNAGPQLITGLMNIAAGAAGGAASKAAGAGGTSAPAALPAAKPQPKTAAQAAGNHAQQQPQGQGARGGRDRRRERHAAATIVPPVRTAEGFTPNPQSAPIVTGMAVHQYVPAPGVTPAVELAADDPRAAALANPQGYVPVDVVTPEPDRSATAQIVAEAPAEEQGQPEGTVDPDQQAREAAFREHFKATGQPPLPREQMVGIIQQLSQQMEAGAPADGLVRAYWPQAGQMLVALVNWIDPKSASVYFDLEDPGHNWGLEVGLEWLELAWATITELATAPLRLPQRKMPSRMPRSTTEPSERTPTPERSS